MVLDRLIEEAHKQQYAIIDEIEMTPAELYQLIREIELKEGHEVRHEIKKKFKVSGEDDKGNSANVFEFFALKDVFVDNWKKRVYTVTYREVVLRLVDNVRKPL